MSNTKRIRVERGLYKRGKVYSACVTPEGERSPLWRTLGDCNLMEARRLRDEFVNEVRTRKVIRSKATFAEVGALWQAEQKALVAVGELRNSTYRRYEGCLRLHVLPTFGKRQVQTITPDDLVKWHHGRKDAQCADSSIRNQWMALRLVLGYAVRHGYAPANPADALTRRETPKAGASRLRFLDGREIKALLTNTPARYRLALTVAVFCGPRLSELLAIRWQDVNLTDGYIAITGQIGEKGERLPYPKTVAGYRDIVVMMALSKRLKAHKLASPFSGPDDYVFASEVGTALSPRNIAQRGLEKATTDAVLENVTFHTLRHTFASILIAQGNDPVYVANQLGHESPSVTLDVYSHLFDRARHATQHRDRLDSDFGGMLGGLGS